MHPADIQDILLPRSLDAIAEEISHRLFRPEDKQRYKDHAFILAYELRTFEKDLSEFAGHDFYKAWWTVTDEPSPHWEYMSEEDQDEYESMARLIKDIDLYEWVEAQ